MGQPVGMIIEEVEAMAVQLNAAAEQIRQLTATLPAQVRQATWWGADRERFVTDFDNQVPMLSSIAEALTGFSTRANANVAQQRIAEQQG
jgi:hypothetical protein